MANCPKCGKKLRLTDWKQDCPHCNANLMFYGFEERFAHDAKRAEMGNARVRMFFARLKAAFIGGPLQCVRIALVFLPALMLLIPAATFSITAAMFYEPYPLSIIGVYNMISNGCFEMIHSLSGSAIVGTVMNTFEVTVNLLVATAALAAIEIVLEILCFTAVKVITLLMTIVSGLGVALCVWQAFAVNKLAAIVTKSDIFALQRGWGLLAAGLAFAAVFVLNAIIYKKGIKIVYREGDPYRREMAKKVKHGKVKVDDLPLPIFETEEEKAVRLELEAKTELEIEQASKAEEVSANE